MDMITKSFKYWKAQEIEQIFGVRRVWESALLDQWLNEEVIIDESKLLRAEELRLMLRRNVDDWNEPALKFFFIGPLVSLVNFNEENFHGFLEQPLSIQDEEVNTHGNVDFMVATGRQIAVAPFYLLHEYKPESKALLDPKGQLLIAMVAAQQENEKIGLTQPLYGSYVIGRLWFFVILNGKDYVISDAFDATKTGDHAVVFRCLFAVKDYFNQLSVELPA